MGAFEQGERGLYLFFKTNWVDLLPYKTGGIPLTEGSYTGQDLFFLGFANPYQSDYWFTSSVLVFNHDDGSYYKVYLYTEDNLTGDVMEFWTNGEFNNATAPGWAVHNGSWTTQSVEIKSAYGPSNLVYSSRLRSIKIERVYPPPDEKDNDRTKCLYFGSNINGQEVDLNYLFSGNREIQNKANFNHTNSNYNFNGQDPGTTSGGYIVAGHPIDMQRFSKFYDSRNGIQVANFFRATQEDRDVSWNAKVNNSAGPWAKCIVVVAGGGGGSGGGGFFDDNDGASGGGGGGGGLVIGYMNNVTPDMSLKINIGGGGVAPGDGKNGWTSEGQVGRSGGNTTVEIGGITRFTAYGGQGGGAGGDNERRAYGGAGGGYGVGSGTVIISGTNGNSGGGGVAGDDDDNNMSNNSHKCKPPGGISIMNAFTSVSYGAGGNGSNYGNDDEYDGHYPTNGNGGWVRIFYLAENI